MTAMWGADFIRRDSEEIEDISSPAFRVNVCPFSKADAEYRDDRSVLWPDKNSQP
jgi:hypothetical protein